MLIKKSICYGKASLSICVPAYIRVGELEECINSLINQVDAANAEIIIMLNGPSLEVERLVKELSDIHPKIGVYKSEVNIVEKIFLIPFWELDCKAVLVFGDDDVALPGFIDKLLDELSESDLVIANYNRTDISTRVISDYHYLSEITSTQFVSPNEFLSAFGPLIQFISCVAINLKHLKSEEKPESHILDHYGFRYSYYIYSKIVQLGRLRASFIREPIFLQRATRSQLWDPHYTYKVFFIGPAIMMKELRSLGYSVSSLINYARIHIKYTMFHHTANLLVHDGISKKEIIYAITKYHILNFNFYSHMLPLIILPNSILRFLNRMKRFTR